MHAAAVAVQHKFKPRAGFSTDPIDSTWVLKLSNRAMKDTRHKASTQAIRATQMGVVVHIGILITSCQMLQAQAPRCPKPYHTCVQQVPCSANLPPWGREIAEAKARKDGRRSAVSAPCMPRSTSGDIVCCALLCANRHGNIKISI
jgi:hypothetical protein